MTRRQAATAEVVRLHPALGAEAWDRETGSWIRGLGIAGRSPHTIRSYRDSLARWRRWMLQEGRDLDPDRATADDALDFMEALTQEAPIRRATPGQTGSRASTRVQRHTTLQRFFAWYLDQPGVLLTVNPFARVPRPSLAEPRTDTLAPDQVGALLATVQGRSFSDVRDRAILLLMLDTGARRGEIAAMLLDDDTGWTDLRLEAGEVTLRGKGARSRTGYIGAATYQALNSYLRLRRTHPWATWTGPVGDREDTVRIGRPLFLAEPGGGLPSRRGLAGSGIAAMLRRRCHQAGLPLLHPHQLRHTWASAEKENGTSDIDLQIRGGWTGLEMVRRYGAADAERLARERFRSALDQVILPKAVQARRRTAKA